MKWVFAFVTTIYLILSVSCSEKNNPESVPISDNTFSAKEINTNLDISYISDVRYIPENNRLYIHGRNNRNPDKKEYIFSTSADFTDVMEITPELESNSKISCFDANRNGNIAILTENTDKYRLSVYDENRTLKNSTEIESDDILIQNLIFFDNGNILMTAQNYNDNTYNILMYNGNEIRKSEDMNFSWIESTEKTGNSLIITYYADNNEYISTIDIDSMTIKNTEKLELLGNISRLTTGCNDELYIYTDDGIFEKSDNNITDICRFSDLGIDGSYIEYLVSVSDGDFIVFGNDSADGMLETFYISENNLSDLKEIKYITLGVAYTDSFISSEVAEYNKNSADCKVRIIDYSKYNDKSLDVSELGASLQLNMDIISGNVPDMLIISGFTNADNLKQKDCFVNLYDYIVKDDFLPNILKMNETDGNLYALPVSFYIDTIAGKSEYVGNKENWTIDELISAYNNAPQDMELMENADKKSVIENLLYGNLGSFVDYNNQSCNFNSPDMIKFLKFGDTFEYIGQKDINEQFFGMINDKFLLKKTSIHSFEDFHELQAVVFNNEDITFVGYPSEAGSGAIFNNDISFSIFQQSENKAECMDFIRIFFTEDKQCSIDDFPVNKKALYKKADLAMKKDNNDIYIGDIKKDIGSMSETEKSRYIEYICNIDKSLVYDLQIYLICMEEISLFLSGDSTPENTAEVIQNRVNIYINE
ncbi:MAG: hypothetical protein K2K16_13045 [Ruminococcus sp.]|nr:hypothetical protein [Ruminococcus sp.]